MRFLNNTTQPKPDASVVQSAAQIEPQRHVHILIETAMEQSQFADADVELIARQLAGELGKIGAALSDVRASVYALYQGNRPGAEAYLGYLARLGFPPSAQGATALPPSTTHQQVTPVRTIAQQNQAISHYSPGAYGQIAAEQHHEAPNRIAFYSGNLIAELVANSAYSSLVFGERRSGASAILRAISYDQIAKSGQTILDILDLHNGEWGGLEDIRLTDGSQIVSYHALSAQADIEAISNKLAAVANEVKRRQRQQRSSTLSLSGKETPAPYLFLIDGLSELHGALPGWSADRRSKDPVFSRAASSLRTLLCHGPAVGVSCVATAREHSSCLCDAVALGETKLLFLGRVSAGRNGGYRAIDRAIEDKDLMPSPHERSRYREALSVVKRLVQPVVFTPNGIPRLGHLADFGSYLSVDLLMHYQQALEVSGS
jgi:hypothetical protein